MRAFNDTRPLWLAFRRYKTLDEVKEAVRIDEHGEPHGVQIRSIHWKVLLLFDSLDTAIWQSTLSSSRSAYESLRARFSPSIPEAGSTKTSPEHKDQVLLAEIQQDVERCMPGISYFQDTSTQKMLLNVLFVFCKLNPDLSYRQGMHELLAPILWVVEQDAVDIGQHSKLMGEDALISAVLSAEYIEHDAFAIFSQVMQNAKKFYEQTTHTALENPLVSRSQRIASTLLSQIDPELANYFETSGIAPQIFLIRWIRLLFGREFEFADVLTIWDVIFAEDPSLEIVDQICLAMLLRIRWELLDSTYNEALTVLLHYPSLDHDITAQQIAVDALALRANMSVPTGNRLVVKYTGRAMLAFNKPSTPPAFQRNITSFSGMNAFKTSLRGRSSEAGSTPPINFEALLQSTAQNIFNRGEQLGIGKVVRSAIDDVHRKAQEIRETHAPSPSGSWRQRPRSAHGLSAKIKAMEERNSQLAQLLDGAVSQLWEIQKVIAEGDDSPGKLDVEKLSIAIGQVQYVQVYLQDSTLPLADVSMVPSQLSSEDQTDETALDEKASLEAKSAHEDSPIPTVNVQMPMRQASVQGLLDPSDFETFDQDVNASRPGTSDRSTADSEAHSPESIPSRSSKRLSISRPPLSESAYSWMLGQPKEDGFGSLKSEAVVKPDRAETLFSDSKDDEIIVAPKPRKGIRPKKKYATPAVSTDVNLSFDPRKVE